MVEKIVFFILLMPFYVILVWSFFETRESLLMGRIWMYNEEPDLSDEYILYTKVVIGIITVFITIFALVFFFKY
ncbi:MULTISPECIES: hypothetical protein [unclassified Bacillus (in: firmicutes)]|uniref:hypothetical protein n=1 Tax=unclassified Bacillus (in: firmicutes) TaxID=185979 RepID=UPI000BEFAD2A|nr:MULTISPECIES: hypothetical protein [unclassified Bacillus (in: firmicutes)]PEJ58222.1 hypothetical protein CN692_08025 [Bacillus sp. AFS002410]PEL12098.1 hypothetical protein CN601_08825 [Bacillus sp. AFS017336]